MSQRVALLTNAPAIIRLDDDQGWSWRTLGIGPVARGLGMGAALTRVLDCQKERRVVGGCPRAALW